MSPWRVKLTILIISWFPLGVWEPLETYWLPLCQILTLGNALQLELWKCFASIFCPMTNLPDLDLHIFEIISKIIDLDVQILDFDFQINDLNVQIYGFWKYLKNWRSKSMSFEIFVKIWRSKLWIFEIIFKIWRPKSWISTQIRYWAQIMVFETVCLLLRTVFESTRIIMGTQIAIHPPIQSFIPSFVRAFIRSFIHSFIYSFSPSFIHSFIHSLIHWFVYIFQSLRAFRRSDTVGCWQWM